MEKDSNVLLDKGYGPESSFDVMNRHTVDAFRQYFKASRRLRIGNRSNDGLVLYFDKDPDYVRFFNEVVEACGGKWDIVRVTIESEAMRLVEECGEGGIKAVINELTDVNPLLNGNGMGLSFVNWMMERFPLIPMIVITSHTHLIHSLRFQLPSIEFIPKGLSAEEYADVIGMFPKDSEFARLSAIVPPK